MPLRISNIEVLERAHVNRKLLSNIQKSPEKFFEHCMRQAGRQACRQAGGQAGRRAGRQAGRQAGGWGGGGVQGDKGRQFWRETINYVTNQN